MHKVFFEIGGNQGNRLDNINLAKVQIVSQIGRIIIESGIYETPPWGFESALAFYNQILVVETELGLGNVLQVIFEIEKVLGRVRTDERYSSRTMDIDILFFDDVTINTDKLTIPHPRLHLRKFVLVPLCEIAPEFIHPIFKKTIQQLLIECNDESDCERIS